MGWVSLEFTLLHRWFDGFETNFYVGFSIENKMADFKRLYVVEVALVRKNELFRIQLDKTKYYI